MYEPYDVPLRLDLSDLHDALDDLWRCSERDDVEWGACIVRSGGRLSLDHAVSGVIDAVDPSCRPADHEAYLGYVHTHRPFPETGRPYLGFSELDYMAALCDGDALSLVLNGEAVYALQRLRFPPKITPAPAVLTDWERRFDAAVAQARAEMAPLPPGSGIGILDAHLWGVNQELCRQCGFAFYRGQPGAALRLIYQPPATP